MSRLTLCLVIFTCCLIVLSQASRVPFFSDSWACIKCPKKIFRCKSSKCIVTARKNLYNGEAIWTREKQDEVRFRCHQGFQLRGPDVLPCDVCRNKLRGIPPTCEPVLNDTDTTTNIATQKDGFGEEGDWPTTIIY